jgi:hypothetical protein
MKRYFVLAALFVVSLITYIDSVAISSAQAPLAAAPSTVIESLDMKIKLTLGLSRCLGDAAAG